MAFGGRSWAKSSSTGWSSTYMLALDVVLRSIVLGLSSDWQSCVKTYSVVLYWDCHSVFSEGLIEQPDLLFSSKNFEINCVSTHCHCQIPDRLASHGACSRVHVELCKGEIAWTRIEPWTTGFCGNDFRLERIPMVPFVIRPDSRAQRLFESVLLLLFWEYYVCKWSTLSTS